MHVYTQHVTYEDALISFCHLILLCLQLYTAMLYSIVTLFRLDSFSQYHFLVHLGTGYILIMINAFLLRNWVFKHILKLERQDIVNESHFEKQIRYMVQLAKSSKKNEMDELFLITLIYMHMKDCHDDKCICRNRSEAWDPKKGKFANETLPMWKDSVFLRSLNYSAICDYRSRRHHSPQIHYLLIVYSLEIVGNTVKADWETKRFKATHRSFFDRVIYNLPLLRITKKIESLVNARAEQYVFARNKFERVISFDRKMAALK